MAAPVIGIDLGTTNSVVSSCDESGLVTVITDEGGDRIIPSVVHFEEGGSVVVGRLARDYAKVGRAGVQARHGNADLPQGRSAL